MENHSGHERLMRKHVTVYRDTYRNVFSAWRLHQIPSSAVFPYAKVMLINKDKYKSAIPFIARSLVHPIDTSS